MFIVRSFIRLILQVIFKDRIHPLTRADTHLLGAFEQLLVVNEACRVVSHGIEACGVASHVTVSKVIPQTGGQPFFHRCPFLTKIRIYPKYFVFNFKAKVDVSEIQKEELQGDTHQPPVQAPCIAKYSTEFPADLSLVLLAFDVLIIESTEFAPVAAICLEVFGHLFSVQIKYLFKFLPFKNPAQPFP